MDYKAGDRIPGRRWVPCALQLRQYAEASGDFNPIHLDDNYARQMGLKGVIAHGMLTMAQLGVMLTDWIGQNGTIARFEARFEGMVFEKDEIIFSGVIRDCRENTLVCDLEAVNQNGNRVLSGLAQITVNQ